MDNIINNMKNKNSNLSQFATKDENANRFYNEEKDIRTAYFRDIDRIIYSLSYSRYKDKTQVFTYDINDHISKRIMHVQYVSKIGRTIARALNLNEDLVEAGTLGHDLGHVPFGHVGEVYLNKLSLKYNEGYFNHNVQSVRTLMNIENNGIGCNLTVDVLDSILCHNGEILNNIYKPVRKTDEEFLEEYNLTYNEKHVKLIPRTLEGCIVRISDVIGYIGKDIEDAVMLGLITLDQIPKDIKNTLGVTNREIVNTIIMDIINNSIGNNYIKMSDNIYNAIFKLKKFNYENIYINAYTEKEKEEIEKMFTIVFESILNDLTNNNSNTLAINYLEKMSEDYKKNTKYRVAIDIIAGMTDNYFLKYYESINNEKEFVNTNKEVK